VERLSPSFHCPWLSVVAVLVVVGSIPPGDLFLANLLFWAAQRRTARDLGGFEKALDGSPLLGLGGGPQPQKPRSWRGKPPVLRVQFGRSGALFGVYGQIRAAARDANQR
jgi:hypothetical protein